MEGDIVARAACNFNPDEISADFVSWKKGGGNESPNLILGLDFPWFRDKDLFQTWRGK